MDATAGSFIFGAVSSLHCAGMCGPLAACFLGGRGGIAAYHGARVLGYGLVGAVAGALGSTFGTRLLPDAAAWIPIALGVALLIVAAGGLHRLGKVPGANRLARAALGVAGRHGAAARGATLGLLTPLLPCGVLWAVHGSALLAGSAGAGAALTVAFAVGSLPLLWVAQLHAGWLHQRLGPRGRVVLQRALAAAAAGVLLWRGIAVLVEPGVAPCCHV